MTITLGLDAGAGGAFLRRIGHLLTRSRYANPDRFGSTFLGDTPSGGRFGRHPPGPRSTRSWRRGCVTFRSHCGLLRRSSRRIG